MNQLDNLLTDLEKFCHKYPGPAPWTVQFKGERHQKHLVFGAITHGNETGSLPAFLDIFKLLEKGELSFGGKLTFFFGNVAAAKAGKRFLEKDLNRVFTDNPQESREERRAQELMPILKVADLFVDFHQTILDSKQPFYIFPYHTSGYQWARVLQGARNLVTRSPKYKFSEKSVCADEYARNHGVPGITLEMGQSGFSELAYNATRSTIERGIAYMEEIASGTSLEQILEKAASPELRFFEITYTQPFSDPHMALASGYVNFESIEGGHTLGVSDANNTPLIAPKSGQILFPKYPQRDSTGAAIAPFPAEIYNLATSFKQHPSDRYRDDI
ncbi:MAG: succinylglutamate desuccinylase/aspartoacylase family protein [Myxococcota bacterium]|nr:succinylglutamate desuccinylase/aspartoacylase family protein [Myxococcota bacterium]